MLFQYVFAILRNDTIYFQMEPGDPEEPIVELDLQSNVSLSDFIS